MSNKNYMDSGRLKEIIGSENFNGNDGVLIAICEAMKNSSDVDELCRRLCRYYYIPQIDLSVYRRRAENIKRLNADVYLEC